MLKATETILTNEVRNHLIREIDLPCLFRKTAAGRYALMNKLLKKNEWVKLRRGLYQLAEPYLEELPSQYYLANRLVPHSVVTAESALCFHGWIPEQARVTTSLCAYGRNKQFKNRYGLFVYYVPPIKPQYFFTGITREKLGKRQQAFIATPLRALMDYVYWHKINNANRDFLIHSLRIDKENVATLTHKQIKPLLKVYQAKRVLTFLENLMKD